MVECVVEVRKPRAMIDEEDRLTLTITEREDSSSALAGLAFQLPPAPLILTKSSGTTKDQTAATTDPKNIPCVRACVRACVSMLSCVAAFAC